MDVVGMDPAYPDSVTHARVFQIEKAAAMSRHQWRPEMFPDEIKWILAKTVADVDFKLQEVLLEGDMVGVEPVKFEFQVIARRRAISRESGLQEGDVIRDDEYYVTLDLSDYRMTVS